MSDVSKSLPNIVNAATCIILDIEGTTTSIDFVRKDLYMYAEQHISNYVKEHWDAREVQDVVQEIVDENTARKGLLEDVQTIEHDQEVITERLLYLMQKDQKTCAIKELEGIIWKNGFVSGNLVGHVYPDVSRALSLWKSQGKKIFIYSKGSIEAQQLLFKYSICGDLRKYIDGNFDQSIGSKLDSTSYSKICQTVQKLPSETVFFSDHPLELLSAKKSGLNVALVVRDPDRPMFLEERSCLASDDFTINSFSEVLTADVKEER